MATNGTKFVSTLQLTKSLLLIITVIVTCNFAAFAEDVKPVIEQTSAAQTDTDKPETIPTTTEKKPTEEKTAEVEATPETTEQALLRQTNAYRQKYNLRPLVLNSKLSSACQGLANVMARNSNMSHRADGRSPSSRVRNAGYRGGYVLENIAYRGDRRYKSNAQFAQATLRQWINSSGHRRNLLNSQVNECGIAFATNPRTGKTYSAMVYSRSSN